MTVVTLHPADSLVEEFVQTLAGKARSTAEVYLRILRHLTAWIAARPGTGGHFGPEHFTRTALETYLAYLEGEGYSVSHRARVKSAASSFARWLIEEQGLLRRNPTRGVEIPAQQLLAPRRLSPDQRYVLRNLAERADDMRGAALFALGYWAGCRVSDAAWLRVEDAHVGPKIGWLRVGHKGGKMRDIDLVNAARQPLHAYLLHGGRDPESPYIFTSQRSARLTETGVHHWLRSLKARATYAEWELIHDVTYHNLRHDFAHRCRDAGWRIEEVAYYLGHVTKKGTPAIGTTARYTQVSREDVRTKLRQISG